MTKNRIVALLLAGLMTASMASCRVQNTNPGGTEPTQNPPTQTTPSTPDTPITPPSAWQDADMFVYTVNAVKLRKDANGSSTALKDIPKETELHCTKQNTTWYYVEYDGAQGYIAKTSATTENILATNFQEFDGGPKVMYSNSNNTNVRLYPSTADFSTVVGGYKLNDEVTVVSTNGTWYKIKYVKNGVEKPYFVHATCLEDAPVEDPNDDSIYADKFSAVAGTPTMYVSGVESVYFRKAPNTNSDGILTLKKGDSVTVLKAGTIDGKEWTYAVVEIPPKKEGDGITYEYGYVSSDCLAYTNGEMTLENLLAIYTTFTQTDKTMYVLQEKTITIRSAPVFPDEGQDNSLSHPQSGIAPETIKMIKVLATGEVDGVQWFIVEFTKKDGENDVVVRGFVGGKALDVLTSDPSGKPTVTLEDLLLKYPGQFDVLGTPVATTTNAKANCYGTPQVTNEPLKTLDANASVTLVAKQKGDFATWAVIQDGEGAYYFVQISLLNQA